MHVIASSGKLQWLALAGRVRIEAVSRIVAGNPSLWHLALCHVDIGPPDALIDTLAEHETLVSIKVMSVRDGSACTTAAFLDLLGRRPALETLRIVPEFGDCPLSDDLAQMLQTNASLTSFSFNGRVASGPASAVSDLAAAMRARNMELTARVAAADRLRDALARQADVGLAGAADSALREWLQDHGAACEGMTGRAAVRMCARVLDANESLSEARIDHVLFRTARLLVKGDAEWPACKSASALCQPKAINGDVVSTPDADIVRCLANALSIGLPEAAIFVLLCAAAHPEAA